MPSGMPGDRAFWWQWALAAAAGGTLGWMLTGLPVRLAGDAILRLSLANLLFGRNDGALTGLLVAGAVWAVIGGGVTGAILGAAQWLALRRRLVDAAWWIPACSAGWLLAALAGQVIFLAVTRRQVVVTGTAGPNGAMLELFGLMSAVLGAGLAACTQWWYLRRHVRRAIWWIPAGVAGAFVSYFVRDTFSFVTGQPALLVGADLGTVAGEGLQIAAGWGAYGIVTGLVLARLLNPPTQGAVPPPNAPRPPLDLPGEGRREILFDEPLDD